MGKKLNNKMVPLNDHVIIRRKEAAQRTESGLYLPSTREDDLVVEGEVIAVGPGTRLPDGSRAECAVAVGNIVVFKHMLAQKFKDDDGNELLVVHENEILAVIDE